MNTIKEIFENIDELLNEIEEDDVLEEVKEEYKAYDKNMHLLLDSTDLDSYLTTCKDIYVKDNGVIQCFDLESSEELISYITDNDISFDDLKFETAKASCEALKFIIYEAEEDEF